MSDDEWTTAGRRGLGFTDPVALAHLDLEELPRVAGVYAVVRPTVERPLFLTRSGAGHFRGDPSVDVAELERRWLDEAPLVYLGASVDLRARIEQLRQFGEGRDVGHWGGRYVWQTTDRDRYLISWLAHEEPLPLKARLLISFVETYGARPFGNIAG